ncbi:MAG: hypothetical protein WC795_02925 [Candidatus Paceibacterota bacterium]|jgi:hypothetical protein
MESGNTVRTVIICVFVLFGLSASFKLFEDLDANEIMVVQSPLSGELTVHTDPGVKWQGWGTITKYPRRKQYSFMKDGDVDFSKKMRFNDGGHANLYGAASWEMPLAHPLVVNIHKTFGNAEGVEQQAVGKMIDAAIYLSGPLMSSTESSGERRAELVQYINDQAENGVYVTTVKEREMIDPILGTKKMIPVTEISRDVNGLPRRQQSSMLSEFKIKLLPMSISELKYDKIVENQIAERQKATTQVQIAQANAKRAEQDAITVAKQGEADAAKAKWEQEVIKAKFVTEAQQKKEVAKLEMEAAEFNKQKNIKDGEGEAAKKRLVMQANGALEQKLEAWVDVNKSYAEAMSQSNWVPNIVMGDNGPGSNSSGASDLIQMMMANTAKQISLDMKPSTIAKK